jgi:hypothetical protein
VFRRLCERKTEKFHFPYQNNRLHGFSIGFQIQFLRKKIDG